MGLAQVAHLGHGRQLIANSGRLDTEIILPNKPFGPDRLRSLHVIVNYGGENLASSFAQFHQPHLGSAAGSKQRLPLLSEAAVSGHPTRSITLLRYGVNAGAQS